MLSVCYFALPSVVFLSVTMLGVVMLGVIMLSVAKLNVVILSVVAPVLMWINFAFPSNIRLGCKFLPGSKRTSLLRTR